MESLVTATDRENRAPDAGKYTRALEISPALETNFFLRQCLSNVLSPGTTEAINKHSRTT